MVKATNGNGEAGKIKFPTQFKLKVIFNNSIATDTHINNLKKVLLKLQIEYHQFTSKLSSNGKYISISVPVKIDNKETFNQLYIELKEIPGIKYAL